MPSIPLHTLIVCTAAALYACGRAHTHTHTHTLTVSKVQLRLQERSVLQVNGSKKCLTNYMQWVMLTALPSCALAYFGTKLKICHQLICNVIILNG